MNQHYVPRAYLKNFAEKKGKEFFVDVFDKNDSRYFKTNIKNICSEVDLYTLDEDTLVAKDLFIVEKIYANGIEPLYLKAYDILTNNNIFHLTHVQRAEVLIGIFQLYIRNPSFLSRTISAHKIRIRNIYNEAKKKGEKGMSYIGDDFSFKEWEFESIVDFIENKITKDFKEKHISGIGEIGNFHERARFEISIIKDDSEFITSDDPLIMEDLISEDSYPLLRSKEFTIALNKKMALRLYHDNRKQLNRIYRHYVPNGSVASINNNIIKQSSRFLITSKKVLDEQNRLTKNVFDDTSLELKINVMRQILENFPITSDNKLSHEILRFYVDKYDKEGGLSDKDQYEMYIRFEQAKVDFIKRRIS